MAQAYGCEVVSIESTGWVTALRRALRPALSARWLVVLGDMPFILASSIERVVRRRRWMPSVCRYRRVNLGTRWGSVVLRAGVEGAHR
jgi:CTP:molybdopterin cytidylyltransferase MocA